MTENKITFKVDGKLLSEALTNIGNATATNLDDRDEIAIVLKYINCAIDTLESYRNFIHDYTEGD
ncbi:MAG: hypothetical protein IIZ78_00855 [Clostridiales bacterium]|nr:hypothetical protein [Clostridiales bacterium]